MKNNITKMKMLKDPASGKFLTKTAYDRWVAGRDMAELRIDQQWTDDEMTAAIFDITDAPPSEGFALVDAIEK